MYIPYEGKKSVSFSETVELTNDDEPNKEEVAREPLADDFEALTLDEIEKRAILKTLRAEGGNRTKTAEVLNVNIRTLRNKLNQYKKEGEEV